MRFPRLFRRREREIDDEIQAFADLLTQEKTRSGMDPAEARRQALIETGGVEQVKEACYDVRPFEWVAGFARDIRYSARMLRRSPVFTTAVVAILALGIGASATAFALLNGLILRPLPVPRPAELVWFGSPGYSYPIFREAQARTRDLFSGLFAWTITTVDLDTGRATVLFATANIHSTLGVPPRIGRTLEPADDSAAGSLVAVLSDGYWERQFNRDPGVLGATVRLAGLPFMVIGVMPAEFFGVAPGLSPDLTVPLKTIRRVQPEEADLDAPQMAWLHIMGRLLPNLPLERADAAFQVIWPRVMDSVTDRAMPRDRREHFLSRRTHLVSGETGFSRVRNRFREPLVLLQGLTLLLLLAACASAANLLLMRATACQREIALRFTLGAGRGRVARQVLMEALILAAAAVGLAAAYIASRVVIRLMSSQEDPLWLQFSVDQRLVVFTGAAVLLTCTLCSVAPVLRASRMDTARVLQQGRGTSRKWRRWRMGRALVVSQVALALFLVSGAALFGRNLYRLLSSDPGFDPDSLVVVQPNPLRAGYRDQRLSAFYPQLESAIESVPGVSSVSISWVPPVSGDLGAWTETVTVDQVPQTHNRKVFINLVSPGYFATIGQRILRGRDFDSRDSESAPRTCVISETLARTVFEQADPLGRRIGIGRHASRQNLEVIGIVRDAKYQRLQESSVAAAYLAWRQFPEFVSDSNLVAEVRIPVPPSSAIEAIRRRVIELDANLPVRVETVQERIRETLVTEQVMSFTSTALGLLALMLATAGVYGLLAYAVAGRTGELGVRLALGANPASIGWMVVRDSLPLCIAGVAGGMALTLALGHLAANQLFGLQPNDPATLAGAAGLVLCFALLASAIPAMRAARVDPAAALRHE